jgi:hypothetical protein
MLTTYEKQVRLLLRVLALIDYAHPDEDGLPFFALKGGTAINFFVWDMPRLSVDIDLTYCPVNERNVALSDIDRGMQRLADAVSQKLGANVHHVRSRSASPKLLVTTDGATIKVEPNSVIRGTVFGTSMVALRPTVENEFAMSVRVRSMSQADLFGGKLCAALDRQHPRDLFDVSLLLQQTGITEDIRKAFLIYLVSHPRPISEILSPNIQSIEEVYQREFDGMARKSVSLASLQELQASLATHILGLLTDSERQFLISFKKGSPDWGSIDIPHANKLPGVLWKLHNIHTLKLNRRKHAEYIKRLEQLLIT